MSQHDLNIANQGFPAFRADLNSALEALGTTNSGATAPATTFANQLWYDTANNILKIRNEDNDAWISLFTLNQTADTVSEIATAIATLGAGSASNPSLTTAGDTNTGIFFPAADTIAFAEGGVEVMRIDSSGTVIFGGTSNPTFAKLNIISAGDITNRIISFANTQASGRTYQFLNGGATAGLFQIYDETAGATRISINSSGNVGIGVSDAVIASGARLVLGTGTSTVGQLAIENTSYATGQVMGIDFTAAGGSKQAFTRAIIENGTTAATALSFGTATGGNNATEQMRVSSNGFLSFNSNFGSVAVAYGCRVWINFDGRNSIPVRGSGNVSSMADLGVGQYRINYASAMPDANYSVQICSSAAVTNQGGFNRTNALASTYVEISHYENNSVVDTDTVLVAIFR